MWGLYSLAEESKPQSFPGWGLTELVASPKKQHQSPVPAEPGRSHVVCPAAALSPASLLSICGQSTRDNSFSTGPIVSPCCTASHCPFLIDLQISTPPLPARRSRHALLAAAHGARPSSALTRLCPGSLFQEHCSPGGFAGRYGNFHARVSRSRAWWGQHPPNVPRSHHVQRP